MITGKMPISRERMKNAEKDKQKRGRKKSVKLRRFSPKLCIWNNLPVA